MTPAGILLTVGQVVDLLGLVARAFGLDRSAVIRVAASQVPALAPTPPDAGAAYDAAVEAVERPDVPIRDTDPGPPPPPATRLDGDEYP